MKLQIFLKYVGGKATLTLISLHFYKMELASLSLRENFINTKIGEKAVYLLICAICCQIFNIVMFYGTLRA